MNPCSWLVIGATVFVVCDNVSAVTRCASSSFLVPKQRTLRTHFASVTVYAAIGQTFPIVRMLFFMEKFFSASAVAWILRYSKIVGCSHFPLNCI